MPTPRCKGGFPAERVGFEPTEPKGLTRSPGARIRPDYATSPYFANRVFSSWRQNYTILLTCFSEDVQRAVPISLESCFP